LFNALLAKQIANVAAYPFCTIEPNVGIVEVPDERLAILAEIVKTQKILPAIVKFVDIAGLVAGASQGEGLGNKFLANIRECQAIVHVLRAFADDQVIREEKVNPQKDLEIIQTELCLADLQTLSKQKEPHPNRATPEEKRKWEVVIKIKESLDKGIGVLDINLNEEEKKLAKEFFLLTAKPALFVLNVSEGEVGLSEEELRKKYELSSNINFIPICAKIEMELSALSGDERKTYLQELGLTKSGLERLIQEAYRLLGLQTFLTAGEKEVRAWTIVKGDKAPAAAGVIHTDFEHGFIKAKVVSFDNFVQLKGWKEAAEAGKVRLEGKDYVMQEGDVVEFMFNL
jgi:ribosome-binding ATPase